jgi:hypothetical protein
MPSCEKALKQLEDTKRDNDKIKKQYEEDKESYSRWLKRKNDWENKTGDYEKWKKYDGVNREFWANETDGTCWWGENWGDANNWCHSAANKKGYDGENYWAKEWGWCSGRWGNFKCKKDDNTVKDQQDAYKKDVPEVDLATGKYWLNKSEPSNPNYLPVPDIKCCQEMTFKNIKAADVSFNNNTQSCDVAEETKKEGTKKEETKKGKTSSSKKTVNPPKGLKSKDSSKDKQKKKEQENVRDDSTMYIIMFIVILCLFILSSSSLAALTLNN